MAESKINGDIRKSNSYSAFVFQRVGDIVFVHSQPNLRLNPRTQWDTIATVEEEFRPPKDVVGAASWGDFMAVNGGIQIKSTGELQVYASSAQSSVGCWAHFSYLV